MEKFLTIGETFAKGKTQEQQSLEISNFLQILLRKPLKG